MGVYMCTSHWTVVFPYSPKSRNRVWYPSICNRLPRS